MLSSRPYTYDRLAINSLSKKELKLSYCIVTETSLKIGVIEALVSISLYVKTLEKKTT